jgi:O-antigen/teichoic acid export membrane protein
LSLIRQIAAIVWVKHLHPQIRFAPRLSDKKTARELFDYSKITFGITVAWLVLFNTDAVFLGLMVSSAAAGVYAPGAQLMLYLRNAVNVVAAPITTIVSERESRGDLDGVKRIYLKGLAYTSYLSFFMTVGVVVYARPFVALWLDPAFAESAEVMRILAIGAAFFVPQIVGNAVLFGIDKHAIILKTALIECGLKVVLSFLLIPSHGLIGMAWAASMPQLIVYISVYPILIARTLDLSLAEILMSQVRTGFVAMFACTPVAILLRIVLPPLDWTSFAVNVALVTLVGALGAWFVLDRSDKDALLSKLGRRTVR